MKVRFTTIVFFMLLAAGNVFGQKVVPDSTFGVNGYVKFNLLQRRPTSWVAEDPFQSSVNVLPNGKLLLLSKIGFKGCLLVRFNANGSIDSTFGQNGSIVDSLVSLHYNSSQPLVSSSGRIFIWESNTKLFEVRLPSGQLDSTYGVNGVVSFSQGYITSLKIVNEQVVVLIGDKFYKLLSDGSIDPSFNTVVLPLANVQNFTILPDSSLIYFSGSKLGKCSSRGTIDSSFGLNGVYTMSFSLQQMDCINNWLLITTTNNEVVRCFLNGALDSSFANNGKTTNNLGSKGIVQFGSNYYLPSKIYTDWSQSLLFGSVLSLNSAGLIDSSFGVNGIDSNVFKPKNTNQFYYERDYSLSTQNNRLAVATTVYRDTLNNSIYFNSDTFVIVRCYKNTITTDSVWPGDADHNGLADNNDLLPIGVAYGLGGPVRTNASIVWHGESCQDWGLQLLNGTNVKHVDCNGDGSINANDTLAIVQNFGLTHAKNEDLPTAWRAGTPGLNIVLSKDTVRAGDTLVASIQLGDATLPVNNIYGLAFTYNYDALVVDTSKTTITYPSSWLASPPERITISKDFKTTGQIKTAVTRINHINRSGFGEVAQVSMIITTDNINGKDLNYYTNTNFISSLTAIDSIGNPIDLNAGVDSALVEFTPTGIRNTEQFQAAVYPNPASGKLFVKTDGTVLEYVTLRNLLGETIVSEVATSSNKTIDVSGLANGVYILHLETNKGELYRRIVISK